jgi:calcium-binding protein CML
MNVINKSHRTSLAPTCFAFGGGTKPISELMFNKYDIDKNGMSKKKSTIFFTKNLFAIGTISRDELRSLCYDMGYYLSDDELEWACTMIDKDGNGKIDYHEFADWWRTSSRFEHIRMPNAGQTQLICHIAEIFRSYDKHNHGVLNKREFEKMRKDLIRHHIIVEHEHQACQFEEIDRGHDGSINFNELIAWFKDVGVLNRIGIST